MYKLVRIAFVVESCYLVDEIGRWSTRELVQVV